MLQILTVRNFVRATAMSVFCAAFLTASSNAQQVCLNSGQSKTFNYTSSFGAAGSAKAVFTFKDNVIVVQYQNTSTSNTYLSGIGFNSDPRMLPENLESAMASATWTAVAGPGGGLGNYDLIAYGNGKNRLSPTKSGTATFMLASAPAQFCFGANVVHLTSLPNGNSEKPAGVPVDSQVDPPPPVDVF